MGVAVALASLARFDDIDHFCLQKPLKIIYLTVALSTNNSNHNEDSEPAQCQPQQDV